MQENKPVLIIGLGNPGAEYSGTRHNVGFMAIDSFVPGDATWKKEKKAETAHCEINGRRVIFVKPQTFMNNSGDAVGALVAFYKIPIENVIVIHDDMDLKLGAIREKIGGSSAGHNGIKSIDAAIGNDYKRIRIGVGHPRYFNLNIDPADWVLGKFNSEQLAVINSAIKSIKIDF